MGKNPYLSLTEYLARTMNTMQNEKKGLLNYIERFKQEKIIENISIGEKFWILFRRQPRNLRNLMK